MEKKSIASLVFLVQAIINGVNLTIAQPPSQNQQSGHCQIYGNFKSGILQKHRDSAFETLMRSIGSPEYTGYYSTQSGTGKKGEQVYASALCPPNVNVEACRECIKHTSSFLKQKCPKQKEGVAFTSLWKLNCMVHYSDKEFKGKWDGWGSVDFWNPADEIIEHIPKGLNLLDSKLKEKAAGGDNVRKFASGSVIYGPDSLTLYGSMQCTPDLTKEDCVRCLSSSVKGAHMCCTEKGKVSGRSMDTNCYVRYSHKNFLPANSLTVATKNRSKENNV